MMTTCATCTAAKARSAAYIGHPSTPCVMPFWYRVEPSTHLTALQGQRLLPAGLLLPSCCRLRLPNDAQHQVHAGIFRGLAPCLCSSDRLGNTRIHACNGLVRCRLDLFELALGLLGVQGLCAHLLVFGLELLLQLLHLRIRQHMHGMPALGHDS